MSCFANCTPEFKSFLSTYANTPMSELFNHSDAIVRDMAEGLASDYSDMGKDAWGCRPRDFSLTVSSIVERMDAWQVEFTAEIEKERKESSIVLEGVTLDGKPVVKGEWNNPFVFDPIN